jgi:hypothetical protein
MRSAAARQPNVPRLTPSCRASPAHAFHIASPTSVLARYVRHKPQAGSAGAYLLRAPQGNSLPDSRAASTRPLFSAGGYTGRAVISGNTPSSHRVVEDVDNELSSTFLLMTHPKREMIGKNAPKMDACSAGRQVRGRCLRSTFTARSCADDSAQEEGPLSHKTGIRRVHVGGPRSRYACA